MATPGGQISAHDIRNEFGSTNADGSVSLGAYRVSHDIGGMGELPLDTGVPQSGMIKYYDMKNKRLNVVVDFHSGGTVHRQNAASRYDSGNVTYVGNFYLNNHGGSPPGAGGSNRGRYTSVIIHVNKTIGGDDPGNGHASNRVALRTGSWHGDTAMKIDVGNNGRIYGQGGKGGAGSGGEGDGSNGENGTSALGIEIDATVHIRDGGYIQAGYGGGGGGGGGYDSDKHDDELGSGGGGGGGAGFPVGPGGAGGDGWEADGEGGANGTNTGAGEGGEGGNSDNEGIGGVGGDGGSPGEVADNGGDGSGNNGTGEGGEGAGGGSAVRRTDGNITIHYTGETDRIVGSKGDIGIG